MCAKAFAGLFGGGNTTKTVDKTGAAITAPAAETDAAAVSTGTGSGTDRVGIGIGGTKKQSADERKRVPGLGL